jgi:hypothetical protein
MFKGSNVYSEYRGNGDGVVYARFFGIERMPVRIERQKFKT